MTQRRTKSYKKHNQDLFSLFCENQGFQKDQRRVCCSQSLQLITSN